MRLLFVKLKHIGDSLLLTPTLTAARRQYPQARTWVVVRKGSEGILAGCPAIDVLRTVAAPEVEKRPLWNWWTDWQLIRELRRQRFDYAFELTDGDRGRWVTFLSGARTRCANLAGPPLNRWWRGRFNACSHFAWTNRHRVEKDFFTVNDCLPLGAPIPPLAFDRERTAPWPGAQSLTEFALLHPATRWRRKHWPVEKWRELGRHLLQRVAFLVISAGPEPQEVQLADGLADTLGSRAVSCAGQHSWAQLAGLLYRARLFVGVDTAAMHLAVACQCPTVAIFGSSVVNQWRPWQVPHRVVTPPDTLDQLPEELLTRTVETSAVIQACEEMLAVGRVAQ